MHGVHFFGMETKNDHKFLNLQQFLSRQLEKKRFGYANFLSFGFENFAI